MLFPAGSKTTGDQKWEQLGVPIAEVERAKRGGISVNPFLFEKDWQKLKDALRQAGFDFELTTLSMLGLLVDIVVRQKARMPPLSPVMIAVCREADRRIRQRLELPPRKDIPRAELEAEVKAMVEAAQGGRI